MCLLHWSGACFLTDCSASCCWRAGRSLKRRMGRKKMSKRFRRGCRRLRRDGGSSRLGIWRNVCILSLRRCGGCGADAYPFCLDWDILFADDEREANPATFKFIQNALAWRNKDGGGQKGGMLAELLAEEEEESDEEDGEGDEDDSNGGDRMQD
jgi:hypothetical protein